MTASHRHAEQRKVQPADGVSSTQASLSTIGLVLVAIGYLVAQLVLFDESRFLSWDESVYVGKASNRFPTPYWAPHRALGVPWLLKPAFWISGSLVWMRWYLAIVSTLFVALGFGAWRRTAGLGAPVGMALFCSTWMALFYGSEASPNLFVAGCTLGALGFLVDYATTGQRWGLIASAALLAVTVLLRPSDGMLLAATLGAAGLLVAGKAWRVWMVAISAGFLLGFLPWLIDSFANFGGPIERWRAASLLVESGLASHLSDHARLLDGPDLGPDRSQVVPRGPVVYVVGWLLFSAVVTLWHRRRPAVVAFGAAVISALPYLVYIGALAPRFLIPAYAYLALAAGIGVVQLAHRWQSVTLFAATLAGVVGFVGSLGIADEVHQTQADERSIAPAVGAELSLLADARPCVVLSTYGVPQMTFLTGCPALRLNAAGAGCQATAFKDSDVAVLIASYGEVPEQLSPGLLATPVRGPAEWRTVEVDPELVDCVEADQDAEESD